MNMKEPIYRSYTLKERYDLIEQVKELNRNAWPEFLKEGEIYHWHSLFETFSDFQVLLCYPNDNLVAVGFSVPITWNGSLQDIPSTIEDILLRALDVLDKKEAPTTLSAVAAIVSKPNQNQGLSSAVLMEIKKLAKSHKLKEIIIPVRPTWKEHYPLTSIERYAEWTRSDGTPFDPWLRVHWRLGAKQLQVAQNTLMVKGTVTQWESWTNMSFIDSGRYIVPGALQPVTIDKEKDVGLYEDPNVWVIHS